jgi:hypothetical protein
MESGMSPDEMKQSIVDILEPFFYNQDILTEMALSALVPEAVNFAKLQNDDWAYDMFQHCLNVHHSAYIRSSDASLAACAFWEEPIWHGLSTYWNVFRLEVPKDDLELEVFTFEIFRNIGALLESSSQPLLRALLHQIRIRDAIVDTDARLTTMTFGSVVTELMNTSGFADLFVPPPWNVPLNQWRNIAQHHSISVMDNIIVCKYGNEPHIHEIRLTRDDVVAVAHRLFNVYNALRTARSIYLVDNIRAAQNLLPHVTLRPEMNILNFASIMATQGFEVIDIALTDDEALAILKDVTDLDPNTRRIHASQYTYQLWVHTNKPRLKIEYREKDNTRSLLATAWAEDCERINRAELEFGQLASLTEFHDLKSGVTIPKANTPYQSAE